jgi:protein-S-isoprenylcysteine O-methyltransferase Ste14
MRRTPHYVVRTISRWAMMTALLSILLFSAAGTTKIVSLRAYLVTYSTVLLIAMLAVDPRLAHERAHPGPDTGPFYLQLGPRLFFLLTVTSAAFFVGPRYICTVSAPIRWFALVTFTLASFVQTWAMTVNPFFSPSIRVQRELAHILIERGPYRWMRHPGYFAMCLSVPASAVAIGSWLALIPATAFVTLIYRRAKFEDQLLKTNLPGYTRYVAKVPSGILRFRST